MFVSYIFSSHKAPSLLLVCMKCAVSQVHTQCSLGTAHCRERLIAVLHWGNPRVSRTCTQVIKLPSFFTKWYVGGSQSVFHDALGHMAHSLGSWGCTQLPLLFIPQVQPSWISQILLDLGATILDHMRFCKIQDGSALLSQEEEAARMSRSKYIFEEHCYK